MVIWLEQDADLHMAQLMPLPLTVSCFSKIQIGLPFWFWLTWVVPEKGPLNGCVCVCVIVMMIMMTMVGAVTIDKFMGKYTALAGSCDPSFLWF